MPKTNGLSTKSQNHAVDRGRSPLPFPDTSDYIKDATLYAAELHKRLGESLNLGNSKGGDEFLDDLLDSESADRINKVAASMANAARTSNGIGGAGAKQLPPTTSSTRPSAGARTKPKSRSPPPLKSASRNTTSSAKPNYHMPKSNDSLSKALDLEEKRSLWYKTSTEEMRGCKEYWFSLSEKERRSLVRIEKDSILKKMKEQQKHSCSCTVCGRKRLAIEEELETLYEQYYRHLEEYAAIRRDLSATKDESDRKIIELDTDGKDVDEANDVGPPSFLSFGDTLTVEGNFLTVADDLIKNDGKKFIDMMEYMAERRLHRELEMTDVGELSDDLFDDEEDEEDEEDYDDEEEIDDDDYADEEDEEDDELIDAENEERRMREGKRMFQIFAARMFEQRLRSAYREKLALERQRQLLEEYEQEQAVEAEKSAQLKLEAKKKKQEKQLANRQKEAEQAKKESARQAQLSARREEERRKSEEAKKKWEEQQRVKKLAERRAQEVDRLKNEEADRLRTERLKREETERLKKEELERTRMEEVDRLKSLETDRLRKGEADRLRVKQEAEKLKLDDRKRLEERQKVEIAEMTKTVLPEATSPNSRAVHSPSVVNPDPISNNSSANGTPKSSISSIAANDIPVRPPVGLMAPTPVTGANSATQLDSSLETTYVQGFSHSNGTSTAADGGIYRRTEYPSNMSSTFGAVGNGNVPSRSYKTDAAISLPGPQRNINNAFSNPGGLHSKSFYDKAVLRNVADTQANRSPPHVNINLPATDVVGSIGSGRTIETFHVGPPGPIERPSHTLTSQTTPMETADMVMGSSALLDASRPLEEDEIIDDAPPLAPHLYAGPLPETFTDPIGESLEVDQSNYSSSTSKSIIQAYAPF